MQDIEKNIKRIADYYKVKHQEKKLVEELGELLVEISKNMMTNKVTGFNNEGFIIKLSKSYY